MKRDSLTQFVRWLVSSPARLLLATWIGFLVTWHASPVVYNRSLSFTTITFLASCILPFVIGALCAQGKQTRRTNRDLVAEHFNSTLDQRVLDRRIQQLAVLGLIGTACTLVDKLIFSGIDYSVDLGDLRMQLGLGTNHARTFLLFVGMILYCFSNAAVLLYVMEGDASTRATGGLVFLTSFSPVVVIVLYAGRSSALNLLVMIIGACIARVTCGRQFWPRGKYLLSMLVIHSALLIGGSLYINSVRAVSLGYGDSGTLFSTFTEGIDASLSPELQRQVNAGTMESDLLSNGMILWIYATHGLSELNYLVNENQDAGPFYGCYETWILYKAIVTVLSLPDQTEEMDAALHHTGFYLTAWGACYLDFGFVGTPWFCLALGLVSGACYRFARAGSVRAQLLLAFVNAYILGSPIHSLFCFGNGFQAMTCILVAMMTLSPRSNRRSFSAAAQPTEFAPAEPVVR